MDDKELKIKIAVDASQGVAGSKEQADALKAIGKVSDEIKRKEVASSGEATEATDKLVSAKSRLQQAIRGVALQIPGIGRFAAALNPITATIAGITLAIYNVKKELHNWELPDFARQNAVISGSAEALKTYLERMAEIATAASSIETRLNNAKTAIEQTAALMKMVREFGGQKDANPLAGREQARAEYQVSLAAADALRKRGEGKVADAKRIGIASAEQDALDLNSLKAQADSAKEQKKNNEAKIADIMLALDPEAERFPRAWARVKTIARQAAHHLSSTQQLYDIYQGDVAEAENVIQRYESRYRQQPAREDLRAKRTRLFAEGPDDISAANAMAREAEQKWAMANARYAGQIDAAGFVIPANRTGTGFAATAQGAQMYQTAKQNNEAFDRAWEHLQSVLIRKFSALASEIEIQESRRRTAK